MKPPNILVALAFVSSVFLVPTALAQAKKQKSPLPAYDDPDGYAVLSALLNTLSVDWKNETVRIGPRTSPESNVAEIKSQCSGIPEEFQGAWVDFDTKQKSRYALQRKFSLTKTYELGYATKPTGPPHRETREETRKRISSGIYYVAPVGFDAKRTRAVAFVEYICGSPCGDSMFYFLWKSGKGWQEALDIRKQVQSCGRIY